MDDDWRKRKQQLDDWQRRFIRQHKSLRVSPAMAAGVSDHLWSFEDVVAKIEEMAPAPKPRGPYKKRQIL